MFPAVQPHRRPTIIHLGQDIYLLAMLGGPQNNQAVVLRFDNTSRQFTDVTPAGLANLNNSMLQNSPAMIFLPPNAQIPGRSQKRIVMAYLRHSTMGSFSPQEMQMVTGDADAAGNVTWTRATTYNFPELDVGPPITEPALAHDQWVFYLAIMRLYDKTSQPPSRVYRLYVHSSADGITWTIPSVRDNLFLMPSGGFLEMAMKSDCTAVVAGIPITTSQIQPPKIYRTGLWPTQQWQPVTASGVFGSSRPMERQFVLITTGRPASLPLRSCQ